MECAHPVSDRDPTIDPPGYRLLERLGEGAYGTVYRARHERTGQDVAIKQLRLGKDGGRSLRRIARFRRELELCAMLNHPHVVRLLDRGEDEDERFYAVFEYVEGLTMQELLRKDGPVTASLLKTLMCQVLEALAYAHRKGVVHRDLKPANIMVRIDCDQVHAKVLDFGMGAFLDGAKEGREALTMSAETIGTPSYAAPEQLRGEPASGKSDLYAWGLVFLECLTGKPVMSGASLPEVVHRQLLSEEIPLPQGIAAHPVGALLRRVLAKRPEDRAGDASQVLSEFREIHLADLVGRFDVARERPLEEDGAERTAEGLMVRSEVRSLVVVCCGFGSSREAEESAGFERLDHLVRSRKTKALDLAARYGGWFAGSLGDFQLFYFGYPVATGQESRLAALFALGLGEENRAQNDSGAKAGHPAVDFRAGIHSGPVEIEKGEVPTGTTATRALRLGAFAAAGQILLSPPMRERMEGLVEARPADDADAHVLLRLRKEGGRVDKSEDPLVGREGELDLLREGWASARRGNGKAFLIRGEAGMGKSALAEAACAEFRLDGADVLHARCLPEHRNSALHPMLDLLRRGLGIDGSETPASQVQRWERVFAESGSQGTEAFSVLCLWLSLPLPPDRSAPVSSPRLQKESLFEVVENILLHMTESLRVVFLDDLHWADPTTLEFLGRVLPVWKEKGSLLLATCRTEFDANLLVGVETISLAGISEADSERMLARIFGKGCLPRSTAHRIFERTGGCPLFLESLGKALAQEIPETSGGIDELQAESVLKTIQSGLMELLTMQIDAIGGAAETARLASVLGREWDDALLAEVSPLDETSLRADLEGLVRAGILVRGEGTHSFRHDLLRDAAYFSMIASRRREYHDRVVRRLERSEGCGLGNARLSLAHHYAGAHLYPQAVQAGAAAVADQLKKSNLLESVRLSLDVLDWMDRCETEVQADARLAIHNGMTQALMGIRGWADPTVKEQIDWSRRLLEDAVDSPHYGSTLCSLMTYHYVSSNRKELACVAEELSLHADRVADVDLQIAARMFTGLWAHGAGFYARASDAFGFVLDNYRPDSHGDHAGRFGLDSRVWSAATLALVEWFRDMPEVARARADQAVEWAREVAHVPSLGIALLYKANLCHYADDRAALAETIAELNALADAHGLPAFQAYAKIMTGWLEDDVAGAEEVLGALESMGCTAALSYYRSLVAEIHARQGRFEAAVECIETCLSLCEKNDEFYYQAPLLVLHGQFLRKIGPSGGERARASFERAAKIAREHGLPLLEKSMQGSEGEPALSRS